MTATPTLAIELTAAAFGVLGTVLLALKGPRAGWGFVAYLASNAGWIAFAWRLGHWGLLAQQVAFTASSLLGVWVWLIQPNTEAQRAAVGGPTGAASSTEERGNR